MLRVPVLLPKKRTKPAPSPCTIGPPIFGTSFRILILPIRCQPPNHSATGSSTTTVGGRNLAAEPIGIYSTEFAQNQTAPSRMTSRLGAAGACQPCPRLRERCRSYTQLTCATWPAGDQPVGQVVITLPPQQARVTTDYAGPPWTGWKVEVDARGSAPGIG